ncbi:hypothetical protein DRN93_05800 [archaeon]|nr:MAG: hypothetical protein DRN93_05800 [archaeon]
MPDPRPGESLEDYLKRCIPYVIEEGTAKTPEQAYAICRSMWLRGRQDGSGKGVGRPGGQRANRNVDPCPEGGPGYGRGGGRGKGRIRIKAKEIKINR